jgi:hypothetical protein
MSEDPPFKPPRALAPIPGVGASRGLAPIPEEPTQQRRRGAVPPIPSGVTSRPSTAAAKDKSDKVVSKDRWALRYQGNAGVLNDSNVNTAIPLEPVIELDTIKPLTVLFWQDTQYPQPSHEAHSQTFFEYLFDGTSQSGSGLAMDRFRLSETDTDMPYSGLIYVAVGPADGNIRRELQSTTSRTIAIRWGGSSYMEWTVDAWESESDGGVDYVVITATATDSLINETDGPLEDGEGVELEVRGLKVANAAVRARVTYTAGKLVDVSFDCDWIGGFTLHASRLEIGRVPYAPDTAIGYNDAPVDVAATVMANAPSATELLQLTVPVAAVAIDAYRELVIPPLARKLNLLLRYGNEGAPGDAPLGQLFVAFVGRHDRSLSYIDAMSAREALFGVGLVVPAGATQLILSNRSTDPSIELGVVWALGS